MKVMAVEGTRQVTTATQAKRELNEILGCNAKDPETGLEDAIEYFRRALPDWWFTVGSCSVSSDATVGPDRAHCSTWMLERFDGGIMLDLAHPATMADALIECTKEAVKQLNVAISVPKP